MGRRIAVLVTVLVVAGLALWKTRVFGPEASRFGASTRVLLTAAGGRVLQDRRGVSQRDAGWHTLFPGRYTARIEFPVGEVREETIDVVVGAQVEVSFAKK